MELLGVLHLLAYEHGTAVSTMAATLLQHLHISSSTATQQWFFSNNTQLPD